MPRLPLPDNRCFTFPYSFVLKNFNSALNHWLSVVYFLNKIPHRVVKSAAYLSIRTVSPYLRGVSYRSDQAARVLIDRIRQNDEAAFRELFEAYYRYLVATAYQYLREAQLSRDLAQDVFVEVWDKRAQLRIEGAPKAYLRRAVINKCLNRIKREGRMDVTDPVELPETGTAPVAPAALAAAELQVVVDRAIAALPERCRVIFCLSRFEQKSHQEIAAALGISTKTIENQMTKALKALRAAVALFQASCWLCFYLFC